MQKETKIVISDSLAEAVKYMTPSIFAGLLVVILTGQQVIKLSFSLILIFAGLYLLMLLLVTIALIPLNLRKQSSKK